MKTFTSTELRRNTREVLNEVTKEGQAVIDHRDREPMVLINKSKLESIVNFAQQKGYKLN